MLKPQATPMPGDLRMAEAAKVECGKAHFKALEANEEPAKYRVASSVEEQLSGV